MLDWDNKITKQRDMFLVRISILRSCCPPKTDQHPLAKTFYLSTTRDPEMLALHQTGYG
jgi:hypothetical protein